ncbi:MAG: hypothetical protein JWO62_1270 [Acidimicrobiaceae bacterium]|nr:hypothetical protein [Acidimicrobiaceae bacterium]
MPELVRRIRDRDALFGIVSLWRGQDKVEVSDPSRTVIEVLDDPRLGGGIRTVAEVLREYLRGELRNDDRLVNYGDRLGNRPFSNGSDDRWVATSSS